MVLKVGGGTGYIRRTGVRDSQNLSIEPKRKTRKTVPGGTTQRICVWVKKKGFYV